MVQSLKQQTKLEGRHPKQAQEDELLWLKQKCLDIYVNAFSFVHNINIEIRIVHFSHVGLFQQYWTNLHLRKFKSFKIEEVGMVLC